MKQKVICLVLLVAAMYLPASSKECAKVLKCKAGESVLKVQKKVSTEIGEEAVLPASPFSSMHLNM